MRMSQGTSVAKADVSWPTSQAPRKPPSRLGTSIRRTNRRDGASSFRYPKAPAMEPGSRATVLVALANAGNITPVSAGNVSSVPPPAIEFIAPAKNALAASSR